jgi:hypothetical protein
MSKILDIMHGMARDLVKAGAMDAAGMKEMDRPCLPAKPPFKKSKTRKRQNP